MVLGNHVGGKAGPGWKGLQVKEHTAQPPPIYFCELSAGCRWRAVESVATTACVLVYVFGQQCTEFDRFSRLGQDVKKRSHAPRRSFTSCIALKDGSGVL